MRRVCWTVWILFVTACAPATQGLAPPVLGYVLPQEYPAPLPVRRTRHRRFRHRRRPPGRHKGRPGLPVDAILVTDRDSIIRQGLVFAARLVIGVKGEFSDRPFISYIMYANDLARRRNANLSDYISRTRPTKKVQEGDLVVLEECSHDQEVGVVTGVCKEGYLVVSNCSGTVRERLLPARTKTKKACRTTKKVMGRARGFRKVSLSTW